MSRHLAAHSMPREGHRGIRARLTGLHFQRTALGILLALPLLVVLLGLLGFPIGLGVYTSLLRKEVGSPGRFIGLGNFIELAQDPVIPKVLANTALYAFAGVAIKTVIGFVAAVILNEQIVARNLFRGWILMPWVLPGIVVGLTGRWMFDQTGGVVNFLLVQLHLMAIPPSWLGEGSLARVALIATNVWHGFPFFAITLLAGMQTIPVDLYEAAEMDGASIFQRLRFITVPWLRPVFTIVLIISAIATANDFTTVWTMTRGGPSNATHLAATYAFERGFYANRMGYGSAVALVTTPFLIVFIAFLATRVWRDDQ
ncbi:MAG: sugar ABC transporter permease [Chloroflexi bacterium]|nr:sugar ABC transporter permease [Chloroflexota bacterium]